MTCVNCGNTSDYLVADPGANPLEYCNGDLPDHLRLRAQAGHFPLTSQLSPEEQLELDEEMEELETVPAKGDSKKK